MQVTLQRAKFMTTLNSYFVENFSQEVVEVIKSTRKENLGGDKYIGNGIWEVSKEVYQRISRFQHNLVIKNTVIRANPMVLTISQDPQSRYGYQKIAAEELRRRDTALLFFDTGTGKTRTSLLALSALSKDKGACIVVGEANLSHMWKKAVDEHFPEFSSRFVVLNAEQSIPKRIRMVEESEQGTIFIVNIESMRNKSLVKSLNSKKLAVTILDECQYIIGSGSQQTQGMMDLNTPFRWALSATPIMNNPLEWYSLLCWLRVISSDGTKTRFKEYYAYTTRNKFGQVEYNTYRNQDDLEALKNFVTIRVEKEGLGLPPRPIIPVPLGADDQLWELLTLLQKKKKQTHIDFSVVLAGKELHAENAPSLFYIERIAVATARSKVKYVLSSKQKKLVVVCNLKLPLDYLHSLMPDDSVLYHGDIPKDVQQQNLDAFIHGDARVLLMTRKSGGTGLDGLQYVSSDMIFLDAPENQARFTQCADRLHRIGQVNTVNIYTPTIYGTLDEFAWGNMYDKQGWIQRYYNVNYEEEK